MYTGEPYRVVVILNVFFIYTIHTHRYGIKACGIYGITAMGTGYIFFCKFVLVHIPHYPCNLLFAFPLKGANADTILKQPLGVVCLMAALLGSSLTFPPLFLSPNSMA
jgi:hypothetical protein